MHAKHSERGSILLLTALSMVVLLGITALAIDASFMFTERNRLASAADAAAKSTALEIFHGTNVNLQAYANREVVTHGYTPSPDGDTDVTVYNPPVAGLHTGDAKYVEVVVGRTTATFFGTVLGWSSLRPVARAVAGTSPSPVCIYVLGTTADALSLANNVVVNMPNCGIADSGGADVGVSANTRIITAGVSIASGSCPSATNMPNCHNAGPPAIDPMLAVPPLAQPANGAQSACPSENVIAANTTLTINPGTYCGFKFMDNSTLVMNSGEYYISGRIYNRNPGTTMTWNGSRVLIYLAGPNGQVDIDSNDVTIDLSARVGGTYNGILFYQQRGNTRDASLSKNNASSMTMSGALYFPDADLSVKNNNGVVTNDCTVIVAKTLDFNNNSNLTNTCLAYNGSPLQTVSLAE